MTYILGKFYGENLNKKVHFENSFHSGIILDNYDFVVESCCNIA